MPRNTRKNQNDSYRIMDDKSFHKQLMSINNLIGQRNLELYGTDRNSEVDDLNAKFSDLINNKIDGRLTGKNSEDVTSFLGRLISSDNKSTASDELLNNQFMSMTGDDYHTMQSFIYDAYRNRLLEQSDSHEIASQLIELSEAILITRDAIISPDIVEGRMNRNLKFDSLTEDDENNAKSVIEMMEKKFKLLEKIKNFIVPKTLEYGEYYAYVIPYSKLFQDFQNSRNKDSYGGKMYRESTIMESFEDPKQTNHRIRKEKDVDSFNAFIEKAYEDYTIQDRTKYNNGIIATETTVSKEDFKKDMENILNNITVCNDPVPLAMLEEGFESIGVLQESMNSTFTEANTKDDMFNRVANASVDEKGIHFSNNDKKKNNKNEFKDITDCYVKLIEPTRIIPIKVVNTVLGYYWVIDEDITPLSGAVSSTLYYTKFDEHRKEATIIDSIANRVVKSFDKKFLETNIKFKEMIVDCIQYYNLNEKRLKFQYIPPEYIQEFKIDEDVNGNGQSMIKKSLFYAKLYLMLLLFKIMSIILNSNDTKVNYIKQSGIDKNIANKVQEIARIRQSKQINMTDLFSYTTLINKVGNGSEMYIPTGRSGERPIETEILSGQDVQLNTELLEMLKNAYILATGVPAAIVNYMQEADFAKVIEQNNTKFNGRVINYQLDFNPSITEFYKKIARFSTNLSDETIDSFEFILQPPKTTSINTKSELISQFNSLADFLIQLFYGDPNMDTTGDLAKEIQEFKLELAKDQLPMLNMDKIRDMVKTAALNFKEKKLKPDPNNGDNGDDLGLEEDLNNINV